MLQRARKMHFQTPHSEMKCVVINKESNFNANWANKNTTKIEITSDISNCPWFFINIPLL